MTDRSYVHVDPATGFADPSDLGSGGAGAGGKVLSDAHTFIDPPGGTPSGAAGGDLSGTYPNPSVVDDSHAHTGSTVTTTDAPSGANDVIDTAPTAGAGTAVARATHGHRLNTYSSAAAAIGAAAAGTSGDAPSRGTHVHPTGAGTPTSSAPGDAAATGAGPAAAMTNHVHGREAMGGTGDMTAEAIASTVSAGASGKVSDAAHRHAMPSAAAPSGGYGSAAAGSAATLLRSDAVLAKPADTDLSLVDETTQNSTTSRHGFLKKLDNSAAHFMDGQGNWTTPAGTAPGVASDTIWDTKGDLAAATGADTAAVLPVGANDTILMAESAETTGLKWVGSQTPTSQKLADAAAQGTADTFARGDHLHGMPGRSTLGTTAAGASFATARGIYIKKITIPTGGAFLMSIHAFVKGNAANSVALSAGILSDSAGAPVSVIAIGGAIQIEATNASVTNLGLSTTVRDLAVGMGVWLAAGDYWIGVAIGAGADSRMNLAFNSGTGTDRKLTGTFVFVDQSFISYGTSSGNDYCIYADILA